MAFHQPRYHAIRSDSWRSRRNARESSPRLVHHPSTTHNKNEEGDTPLRAEGEHRLQEPEETSIELLVLARYQNSQDDRIELPNDVEEETGARMMDSKGTSKKQHDEWQVLSPTIHPLDALDEANLPRNQLECLPRLDQLLFVYKPPRLLTLPGIGPDKADCLASRVNTFLFKTSEGKALVSNAKEASSVISNPSQSSKRKRNASNKKYEPRPVHRLDYDTSGVMVTSLTKEAHRTTSKCFEERTVQKCYVALVAGHVPQNHGWIEYPIGKINVGAYNEFACLTPFSSHDESDFVPKSLRQSKTEYKVLQRYTISTKEGEATYTRVELKPWTGRGHQLRLHMASLGHSILGDTLHAGSVAIASCVSRLCLHACRLELTAGAVLQDNDDDDSGPVKACKVVVEFSPPF
jgi:tRNA pseudouridine32 synthase/23S rRNA pseudouridine746 synthase